MPTDPRACEGGADFSGEHTDSLRGGKGHPQMEACSVTGSSGLWGEVPGVPPQFRAPALLNSQHSQRPLATQRPAHRSRDRPVSRAEMGMRGNPRSSMSVCPGEQQWGVPSAYQGGWGASPSPGPSCMSPRLPPCPCCCNCSLCCQVSSQVMRGEKVKQRSD